MLRLENNSHGSEGIWHTNLDWSPSVGKLECGVVWGCCFPSLMGFLRLLVGFVAKGSHAFSINRRQVEARRISIFQRE